MSRAIYVLNGPNATGSGYRSPKICGRHALDHAPAYKEQGSIDG
jgi:3-dehydroquinate dehydratase